MKEVCKLNLENDPRDYSFKDIEHILQTSAKRKPKWHSKSRSEQT